MCMLKVLCGNPALSTDFWNVLDRSGQRTKFTSFLQFSTYGECTPTTGGRGCEKDLCCNGLMPTALLQQVTQKSSLPLPHGKELLQLGARTKSVELQFLKLLCTYTIAGKVNTCTSPNHCDCRFPLTLVAPKPHVLLHC